MVKIQLGVIQAEFNVQDLKPKVEYVRELVSQTIRDVRSLTFELSPPMLYELGLQAALEGLPPPDLHGRRVLVKPNCGRVARAESGVVANPPAVAAASIICSMCTPDVVGSSR